MTRILDDYLTKQHGQEFEEASVALVAFSGEDKKELLFPIDVDGILYNNAIKDHGSDLLKVESTIRQFCIKSNVDTHSVDKYSTKLRNSVLALA